MIKVFPSEKKSVADYQCPDWPIEVITIILHCNLLFKCKSLKLRDDPINLIREKQKWFNQMKDMTVFIHRF